MSLGMAPYLLAMTRVARHTGQCGGRYELNGWHLLEGLSPQDLFHPATLTT